MMKRGIVGVVAIGVAGVLLGVGVGCGHSEPPPSKPIRGSRWEHRLAEHWTYLGPARGPGEEAILDIVRSGPGSAEGKGTGNKPPAVVKRVDDVVIPGSKEDGMCQQRLHLAPGAHVIAVHYIKSEGPGVTGGEERYRVSPEPMPLSFVAAAGQRYGILIIEKDDRWKAEVVSLGAIAAPVKAPLTAPVKK